jgi:hypothetical protein
MDVAVDPLENRFYVLAASGTLTTFDAATYASLGAVSAPATVVGGRFVLDAARNRIYASSDESIRAASPSSTRLRTRYSR